MNKYLDNLDNYEVDKIDYDAYFYRLPKNDLMKITPQEGLTIYKDTVSLEPVCGILTEQIMAMPANRYFLFNFLEEERLGPHKLYKHITLPQEEYEAILLQLNASCKRK